MITINANNILVTLIRALPAFDAFARALGDQVTIFTGHNDLFIGRPYAATDKPVDTDYTLIRRETPLQENPRAAVYGELLTIAELHGAVMPKCVNLPVMPLPWDPERLYCVDNRYLVRPLVALFQNQGLALDYPAGHLVTILKGLEAYTRVLHVLLDNRAPALSGAIELALPRSEGHGYAQPTLLEVMKAVSAAGVVVTNAWWVHDLAVAYRRPVAFLLPQPVAYGRPYGDCLGLPPVEVVRAGGCLVSNPECGAGASCAAEPPRQCVNAMNTDAAIAQIRRLL